VKRPWLAPLVPIYAAGVGLREARLRLGWERVERLGWPVVSVGNLSTGGAGKTPFTIALAELLAARGVHVDVLSRGYGRSSRDAARVNPEGTAEDFGDEPLEIARRAGVPVFVARRRVEAGRLAEAEWSLGAGPKTATCVHLLDDGFQHRQLGRDLDVVLVSAEDFRDGLLPAGNLREGVSALGRADVVAVAAGDEAVTQELRRRGLGADGGKTVWRYRRTMAVPEVAGGVVAFCGIARPGQFFSGLEAAGVRVAARHAFGDHHRFEAGDIALLRRLAEKSGAAAMITTEKDRIRLGRLEAGLGVRVYTAGLRIEFEDEEGVAGWLERRLFRA
jgi:tetraacyldisaccharide 4'-kinase